ncbi:MAG: hypothetical protein JXM70_10545 [Pirellulales bacterium]|nr:hypothetical protein [Pirellulales bacterium]
MVGENTELECETNRRCQERLAYQKSQRIAPLRGNSLPNPGDFFKVCCNDLTSKGFSFFVKNPPDFDKLVVALESPENTIYVNAEVRHHRKVLYFPSSGRVETLDGYALCGEHLQSMESPETYEPGIPMTLVGCCFTWRFE